jgi:hypothetical protein
MAERNLGLLFGFIEVATAKATLGLGKIGALATA